MAAQAVICAACGAKVKSGRVKCLRCGEPLVARADAPAPSPRPIPWKILGIATGCLVLGGVAVMLTGREQPPQSTTPTAVVDASRVPSAPARAAASSSQATAPDPANTAVSDLMAGQQAYVSGNIDASVQQLQAAVDANPNDPRALSDLGQVLVRTGRAREAVTYLDKAVSLKPDSWVYQFNRARAYATSDSLAARRNCQSLVSETRRMCWARGSVEPNQRSFPQTSVHRSSAGAESHVGM